MLDLPGSDADALERFLSVQTPPSPNEAERHALLRQTLGIVRRRRRLKRLGLGAALAACSLAGLITMRLWMPPPAAPNAGVVARTESTIPNAPEKSVAVAPPTAVEESDLEAPPLILERLAAASKSRRAQLYRAAGDRYLQDQGDMRGALRCYGLALEAAGQEELAIVADDSWLLMALKKARLEERNHDKNGG